MKITDTHIYFYSGKEIYSNWHSSTLDAPTRQEIGGEIEDEANVMSGRITKYFIKNILTKEDKQHLGLGNYGS